MQAKIDVSGTLEALDDAVRAGDEVRVGKFVKILSIASKKVIAQTHEGQGLPAFAKYISVWSSINPSAKVSSLLLSQNPFASNWLAGYTSARNAMDKFDFDAAHMFNEILECSKTNPHLRTAATHSCLALGRDDILKRLHLEGGGLNEISEGAGFETKALVGNFNVDGAMRCVRYLHSIGVEFSKEPSVMVHPGFHGYAHELHEMGVVFHPNQNDSWASLVEMYTSKSIDYLPMAEQLIRIGHETGQFKSNIEAVRMVSLLGRLDENQAGSLMAQDVIVDYPLVVGRLLSSADECGLMPSGSKLYARQDSYYAKDLGLDGPVRVDDVRSLRYGRPSEYWSGDVARSSAVAIRLPSFGGNPIYGQTRVMTNALGYACAHGSVEAVRTLVQAGYDVNAPTGSVEGADGVMRPLTIATYFARKDIVRELVSLGARADYPVALPKSAMAKGSKNKTAYESLIDFASGGCRRLASTLDAGDEVLKILKSSVASHSIMDVLDEVRATPPAPRQRISGASL